MYLYLIRHGESHINLGNWDALDTMDTPLTEKGIRQAAALRDYLKERETKADVLYASSMRRTQETAGYVSEGLGLPIVLDDRVRELACNYRDGTPVPSDLLPRTFHEYWVDREPIVPRTDAFENGENWIDFRNRTARFVEDMVQQHHGQTVYVVAHTGTISAILDNVLNVPIYRHCDLQTSNTGVTLIAYRPEHNGEKWNLMYMNRVDHLVLAGMV